MEKINIKNDINWPEVIPNNYKIKGKNYIHYSCEAQDLEMLERAIQEGHDLKILDDEGRSPMTTFLKSEFYDPNLIYIIKYRPLNPFFLEKMLSQDHTLWDSNKHTYYFLNNFKKQTVLLLESNNGELKYKEKDLKELISIFESCLNILKKFNINLNFSDEQFEQLKFNSLIQKDFIKTALSVSDNPKNNLKWIISNLNFFNCPQIKEEIEETLGFFEKSLVSNNWNKIILTTQGSGKSMLLNKHLMNSFLLTDKEVPFEEVIKFWEYIINQNEDFEKAVCYGGELYPLIEKNQNSLAKWILKKNLDSELSIISQDCKKSKI